jgi:predicted DNA-binding WGR domain protein
MSAGELGLARVVLRALNPAGAGARHDDAPDGVVRLLAEALRARGYEIEQALGHSHFRCDLAVKRPGDAAFRLAVFVDTEPYYRERDVLERDVLRPKLLRAFGWSVAHVLAKDWYEDAVAVVARLERQLQGDTGAMAAEPLGAAPGEIEPLSDREVWLERGPEAMALSQAAASVTEPPATPASPTPGAPETTPPSRALPTTPAPAGSPAAASAPASAPLPAPAPVRNAGPDPPPATPAPAGSGPAVPTASRISQLLPGQTRYFEFIGGNSKKYWHVTVDGCELVVSFGRIGTAGQLKRKTFPSEAMARHEAEGLIREKLGKGYQELHPD